MRNSRDKLKPEACLQYAKASFTVEASLLMAIILPVLIAILLAGFYLHDSASLETAVTELCAMGSNLRGYGERSSDLEDVKNRRLSHSLLWTRQAAGTVSSGEEDVSARLSGTFPVPGLVGKLMGSAQIQVTKTWSRRLYRPAEMIWKIRAVKYLADSALS